MLSADEIVSEFNIDDFMLCNKYDVQLTNMIKEHMNLDVEIEIYKLNHIKPFKFYVKEFVNRPRYELMCVPLYYYPQVYKKYNDIELNDYDLSFFFENQVARFVKPLKESRNENELSRDTE